MTDKSQTLKSETAKTTVLQKRPPVSFRFHGCALLFGLDDKAMGKLTVTG